MCGYGYKWTTCIIPYSIYVCSQRVCGWIIMLGLFLNRCVSVCVNYNAKFVVFSCQVCVMQNWLLASLVLVRPTCTATRRLASCVPSSQDGISSWNTCWGQQWPPRPGVDTSTTWWTIPSTGERCWHTCTCVRWNWVYLSETDLGWQTRSWNPNTEGVFGRQHVLGVCLLDFAQT